MTDQKSFLIQAILVAKPSCGQAFLESCDEVVLGNLFRTFTGQKVPKAPKAATVQAVVDTYTTKGVGLAPGKTGVYLKVKVSGSPSQAFWRLNDGAELTDLGRAHLKLIVETISNAKPGKMV
jgi:hypothetical protein